jgi:DmsE family decaheme c-type cytochrome
MTCKRVVQSVLLLAFLSLAAGVLAGALGAPAQNPPQAAPAQAAPAQAGSVSDEDCAVCHEDVSKAFEKNPHAILKKSPKFNLTNSCESCHGPGEAHVSSDGDRTKILTFADEAKKVYNKQCLSCHTKDHELLGFAGSLHSKSGLACSDCHRVHSSAPATQLLRQPESTLCMSCHVQRRTDFAKPFHHRVREGAMRCSDCHQPHSGVDRRQRRLTSFGETTCVKCHNDKQGPFVFEHAPLVIRDCQSCHEPHGSNNAKMLVRSTVRSLCLECHSASANILSSQTPAFHDVRSPRFQNCTTCHVKIHGSNASRDFFR